MSQRICKTYWPLFGTLDCWPLMVFTQVRTWNFPALVTYLTPLNGLYFSPNMSRRLTFRPVQREEKQSEHWLKMEKLARLKDLEVMWWGLPDMATCWILRSMLSEGLSSGLGAPACRLRLPRRLGSFWGFSFPMSQTSTYQHTDMLRVRTIKHIFSKHHQFWSRLHWLLYRRTTKN